MSRNYITHFTTIKTDLIRAVGGFRQGYEGSQDFDLFLRVTEKTDKIFHIARILYHWRIHSMSTSGNASAKPYASDAGVKALKSALERRNEKGDVITITAMPGFYKVKYLIKNNPSVSILIDTSEIIYLKDCIGNILSNTLYNNFDIYLIITQSEDPTITDIINSVKSSKVSVIKTKTNQHKTALLNYAKNLIISDYLVFIDSSVKVKNPFWLDEMLGYAQKPSIGVVGTKLSDKRDFIVKGGFIIGFDGTLKTAYKGMNSNKPGYIGELQVVNNYAAISSSCMMIKKETFEIAGGFTEDFKDNFLDADFCLRLLEQGFRHICLPLDNMKAEGKCLMPDNTSDYERLLFLKKWNKYIIHDPYYNTNLSKKGKTHLVS